MKINKSKLTEHIGIVYELCGADRPSRPAMKVIVERLSGYPREAIMASLQRCQDEVRGRLSLADIIQRIPNERPGADEAWAMLPRSEAETVVWTSEMANAWDLVKDMGWGTDARMAFKEAYQRMCLESKTSGGSVKWQASLGHDKSGREKPLNNAVRLGRLTAEHISLILPEKKQNEVPLLENKSDRPTPDEVKAFVAQLTDKKSV